MTPEAQRIAIAEACGRTNVAPVIIRNVAHQGDDRKVGVSSDQGWIPDYLSDLNAMHEAEKILPSGKAYEYWHHLFDITRRYQGSISCVTVIHMCNASAAQRAEAFLRTSGRSNIP